MMFIDSLIQVWSMNLWNTPIATAVLWFSTVFDTPLFLITLSLYSLLLITQKNYTALLATLSALSITALVVILLKNSLMLERPAVSLIQETGYGMPSGHSAIATSFFFLIAHFTIAHIKNIYTHHIFLILTLILASGVAFSRGFLQVHSATQVLAGICVGLLVTQLTVYVFERHTTYKKTP